jgi:hypothetical protein
VDVGNALVRAIEGEVPPDTVLVRIEPALNRAVDFAMGEGLLRRKNSDRVELTPDGIGFADTILADTFVLGYEKQFVERIRFKVSEDFVTRMFELGGTV